VNVLPGQPHSIHRPRGEVLDQHVGVTDQLVHDLLALGGLGVDRQRSLVGVEHREIQRIDVGDIPQLVTRHIATGEALDFQHVGAEPGEHLGAGGAGLYSGEVDDFDSSQWQVGHDGFPFVWRIFGVISVRLRWG
jgi:hypothetical protein